MGNKIDAVYPSSTAIVGKKNALGDICISTQISKRPPLIAPPKGYIIAINACLKRIGFFGSLNILSTAADLSSIQIYFGYKFPSWVGKALSVYLQFSLSRWSSGLGEIAIRPGYIRLQNQVSLHSRFMQACQSGDLQEIRECVEGNYAGLNDRTLCTGRTPLLVSEIP